MAKKIAISEVLTKVEQQKRLALQSPILVIASGPAADSVRPHADGLSSVFQNPNLFSFIPPSAAAPALASAVHRTLVFFFYRSDSAYQEYWFDRAVAPSLLALPIVDLFKVDITSPVPADAKHLRALGVEKAPCALVYRMGHLVDRIMPETENALVAAQVAEYKRALRALVASPPAAALGDRDAERRAFENREREKEAQRRRKEWQEQVAYRQQVERQLEEAKRQRQARDKH
jgi:hypothetical protein